MSKFSPISLPDILVELWSDQVFVQDNHQNQLFFPWGNKGKGFILPDAKKKSQIIKSFRWIFWLYFVSLAIPFTIVHNAELAMLLIGGWILFSLVCLDLYMRIITRNYPCTEQTYSEVKLELMAGDVEQNEDVSDGLSSEG